MPWPGAFSISRPAYMTAMVSAISMSSDRSWVMNRMLKPSSLAQFHQLFEDLALDHHVESGGRLVHDQQLGAQRQRQRDHHPLPHAAGELVRIAVQPVGARCRPCEAVPRRACAADPPTSSASCAFSTSSRSLPTRSTGLRACRALWNTTAICVHRTSRRTCRSSVSRSILRGSVGADCSNDLPGSRVAAVAAFGPVVEVRFTGGDDARDHASSRVTA